MNNLKKGVDGNLEVTKMRTLNVFKVLCDFLVSIRFTNDIANEHVVTTALFVPSGARHALGSAVDDGLSVLSSSEIPMSPSEAPLPPLSPAEPSAPQVIVPSQKETLVGAMIVCADYNGEICVYCNTGVPQWKQ